MNEATSDAAHGTALKSSSDEQMQAAVDMLRVNAKGIALALVDRERSGLQRLAVAKLRLREVPFLSAKSRKGH